MILVDAGPLIALLDENDSEHAACVSVMRDLPSGPLGTTWPCLTEAFYLLDSLGGYRFQDRLWRMRRECRLLILDLTAVEADRMNRLMEQYQNVPMDLADASLVAVAESRDLRQVFTIDSDFYIYRLTDGSVVEVVRRG